MKINIGITKEEKALLIGACREIEADMEFGMNETYFDDGHPHRGTHDELDDDAEYEVEPDWDKKNGAKVVKFLKNILENATIIPDGELVE